MKLTAGFGKGMGCLESTWCVNRCCHGIWNVDRWSGTMLYAKELVNRFQAKSGATICKDLKGLESGKPYVNVRIVSAMLLWH